MHEPLSREMRISHSRPGTLGLVWACALIVILAIGFVAIAVIVGERSLRGPRQAAGPPTQTTAGAATLAASHAASSTSELFSGMPLP
jgi:hypothetical protein